MILLIYEVFSILSEKSKAKENKMTPWFYYSLKTLEMIHSKLIIKGRAYVEKINQSMMPLNFKTKEEKKITQLGIQPTI